MRLEVLAPENRSPDTVLNRVEARAAWIAKQWRYFGRYQPAQPERQYISGETNRYLGRQYRLKVTKAAEPTAKLAGKFLYVRQCNPKHSDTTKTLVQQWYRDHAESTFARRMLACQERSGNS